MNCLSHFANNSGIREGVFLIRLCQSSPGTGDCPIQIEGCMLCIMNDGLQHGYYLDASGLPKRVDTKDLVCFTKV